MKNNIQKYIVPRGKRGIYYLRRRIPSPLRVLYGGRQEYVRSLGTADAKEAASRAAFELASLEAEFLQRRRESDLSRASLAPRRIQQLSTSELEAVGRFWARQVLLLDQKRRDEGLEDAEFEELGSELKVQRSELGRMLAQGTTDRFMPALQGFLHLCGIDFAPADAGEAKRAARQFLGAVVKALDLQIVSGGQRVYQ